MSGDDDQVEEQEMISPTGGDGGGESSTAKTAEDPNENTNSSSNNNNKRSSSKFFELFRFGSRSSNDDTEDEDEDETKNDQNGIQENVFGDQPDDDDSGDESDEDYVGDDIQDIADSLRDVQLVIPDTGSMKHEEDDQKEGGDETEDDDKSGKQKKSKDDFWGNAMKMILGGGGGGSGDDGVKDDDTAKDDGESLSSAVAFAKAAVAASRGEMAETKAAMSPDEWLKLSRVLLKQLDVAFGEIPVNKIDPVAFPYYLESQDAKKNPSWKRRLHRFMPGVPKETIFGLHDALYLSQLAYVDTVEEVQAGLEKYDGAKFELVFCTTESTPVVPAHFMVVKKEPKSKRSHKSKSWSLPWSKNKHDDHKTKEYVEIVLSIRGTKTVEDMFSDALLECTEYRGGKAHDGVCASGISIVEKHTDLILRILKMSGRKKVRLTLLGHSLGAGAASIACIEFNENHPDKIEADCIGFGCPALLSLELSEKWKDKITTVVNDADMVVRMSGATVANLLMDVLEFDYQETLMEDVKQLADLVSDKMPILLPEDKKSDFVDWFEKKAENAISPINGLERKEVQLWPPGRCLHFYRDGVGVSCVKVPCTLFNEFDVARTMLDDHLVPNGYEDVLLGSIRSHLKDPHFTFKNDVLSLRGQNITEASKEEEEEEQEC